MSFAYSGSMDACTPAFGNVARCQAPRISASSNAVSSDARRPSVTSGPLDAEARDVRLGLGHVEGLAHDDDLLRHVGRGGNALLLHALLRVGHEIHALDDILVAHLALHVSPALHLREDP